MSPWILIIVLLNTTWSSPGSSSYEYSHPSIAMQEFEGKDACLFARKVVIERAGEMAKRLNAVCVPKGSK